MSDVNKRCIPSVQHRVSAEEWQMRVDLAAGYRLVAQFGWSDLVFTHITARVPAARGRVADITAVDVRAGAPCVSRLLGRGARRAGLIADLGNMTFLMLRNHGPLTLAPSIADEFLAKNIFEAASAIQLRAQAGGAMLSFIPDQLIAGAQAQAAQATHSLGGKLVWPGLRRMLDRLDSSCAT